MNTTDKSTGKRMDVLRLAQGVLCGMAFAFLVHPAAAASADEAAQSDAVRAFAAAYAQIKERYADTLDEKKLVANAIKGMIGGLDPFSYYLDSDDYEGVRQDAAGAFGGLGMEVSMESNAVKVISAFEDSPAWRAGLQPGDLITRFGDTSVAGLTLDQAVQQARGAPDTSVALTILRGGEAQPRVVTLTRAVIQARSVRSAAIDPAYVYLQITHFNKNTAERLLAELAHAYETTGLLNGVVLDLRDNPGGVLGAAVAVSSLFLPKEALVVYTESASPESRMRLLAKDVRGPNGEVYSKMLSSALKSVPLVVLVNGGSASASEIVAGALQSHKRANIVGGRTFGKGTVQVVLPLTDGAAMKLTTAYYYTPDGHRIQGSGVTPDIPVDALAVGAIPAPMNDAQAPNAHACMPAAVAQETKSNSVPAAARTDDCQLERAFEILRRQPVLVRS